MANLKQKTEALRDIWAFADLINYRGGSDTFYELHREMAEINCRNQTLSDSLRENRRRLFLVPREHRKSTVNTVLYILWRVYRNPDIRILIGTNVKDLATEFVSELRAYFEDEELQSEVWNARPHISGRLVPLINKQENYYRRTRNSAVEVEEAENEYDYRKVIWSNWKLRVVRTLKAKEPTVTAISVGMKPTGKHYDLVILDDIVDIDNSSTPEKARKVLRWANALESVVTKKAIRWDIAPGFYEWLGNEIVINGTRYYHHDYYSKFVGNKPEEMERRLAETGYTAYVRSVYKNGVDDSDGWLCPEIYDAEVDSDMRRSLADDMKEYWAQFHNKVILDEDQDIHSSMIRYLFPDHIEKTSRGIAKYFDHTRRDPVSKQPEVHLIRLALCVDLAGTQNKRSDRSVVGVGGLDDLNRFFLLDMRAGKWKTTEIIKNIQELAQRWFVSTAHIEAGVGTQNQFLDALRASFDTPGYVPLVVRTITTQGTGEKRDRIKHALQPYLDSGRFFMMPYLKQSTPIIDEMDTFGAITTGKDDCLDTVEKIVRVSVPTPKLREDGSSPHRARHIRINNRFGGCR